MFLLSMSETGIFFASLLHTCANVLTCIRCFRKCYHRHRPGTLFYGGKFFGFSADGFHRPAIHPIDLQLGLLLQNTLFFPPVVLKDVLHFWEGGGIVGTSAKYLMPTLCVLGICPIEARE